MRELNNIEERILDRALYLMGTKKTCDISIRAIAKEANVNVGAINYYFRTKDEMVRLVKEFYIENTMTVLDILKSEEYGDEEKLLLAANEIMEYALRFPGNMVIHAHSLKMAGTDETSARIIRLSAEIGERLKQLLRNLIAGDEISHNYKYLMFTSSINYPTEYEGVAEMDSMFLMQKEARMEYLKLLIRALQSA
ncbi:TetR/AcrR family transcriptional regulator [Paenibacillus sp. HN-1]|uniref:TetR/AcrR family transcriptional regulator n=1 Tax=Paenibacillus TaxID=44249 RepID=UPI001CA94F55|nr:MULTISPECIES: TetR/AcrR family transcriptional regulator [Paenibacillus]MBY9079085.1 TetR/AcrR family transcriptional regulator [Paenibacillus sp. CGMCC 1.18879]MBY9086863.1 TetR/AcrR family transcriptional regulator [Paenibacillus sinensis]